MPHAICEVPFHEPRVLTPAERDALRVQLRAGLPRLRRLLESTELALNGPDPEAAFVFLGILGRAATDLLIPR